MSKSRRYRLACPVARALDRVGDRWALLILRDLHAGPARFSDLLSGLGGIATNMLTDRLQQLMDDGLVERRQEAHGVTVYDLTELGGRTEQLIFEMAMFGALLPVDDEVRSPGNLRTIVIPMRVALRRVVPKDLKATVALRVDGEPFTIRIRDGDVSMKAGAAGTAADLDVDTSYEPLLAASEGEMTPETFLKDHVQVRSRQSDLEKGVASLFLSALRQMQVPPPAAP